MSQTDSLNHAPPESTGLIELGGFMPLVALRSTRTIFTRLERRLTK